MKAHDFFKMLETTNEFKKLLGEQPARVEVINHGRWGYATTYKEFKKIITDTFHPESVKGILAGEVEPTWCLREVKIDYIFDGKKMSCTLFVE